MTTANCHVSRIEHKPAGIEPDPFEFYVYLETSIVNAQGELIRSMGQGGGTCVARTDNGCMVLTVAHVCDGPEDARYYFEDNPDRNWVITPSTISERVFETAIIVEVSIPLDLCLLDIRGHFPPEGEINEIIMTADVQPFVRLISYGAPRGIFEEGPDWELLKYEGDWTGFSSGYYISTTLPIRPGMSGSGILLDNRLFSVVARYRADMPVYGIGVPPEMIAAFLEGNGVQLEIYQPDE